MNSNNPKYVGKNRKTSPVPYFVVLAFLAERGIGMAAATSSPRGHVTRALARLGLLEYFTEIFTTGEIGVSKHKPDIYRMAAERLGTAPERWGKPLAALLGALDAQMGLGIASIGGKDSMSGSFEQLDVPPTLVSFATAIGKAGRVISTEFKKPRFALWFTRINVKTDGSM